MFLLSKNIANVDVYLQYEFFFMGNNYPTKNLFITELNIYPLSQSKLKTNIALINYTTCFFICCCWFLSEKLYFIFLTQS